MSTIRTMIIVAVLASVGYGVYVTLHSQPPNGPPPEAMGSITDTPPSIDLPSPTGHTMTPSATHVSPSVGGVAPPFTPSPNPAPLQEAPPFSSSVASGNAGPMPIQTPPLEAAPRFASPAGGISQPGSSNAASREPPQTPLEIPAATGPEAHTHEEHGEPSTGGSTISQAGHASPVNNAGSPSVVRNVHAEFAMALEQAKSQLNQGQLAEAHLALSGWYDNPKLTAAEHDQLMKLLDRVAGTVIYSRVAVLEAPYEVQPGDTLERIAEYYDVPWQLLAKINGIEDPNRLQTGQPLKVVHGKFSATVDLGRHLLTLWLDGRYAGRFAIGVGRDYSTPQGEFIVQNKVENPTYYGPDRVIAAEDPNNPLGERWIDLGNQIGIHGTNDPASIGRNDSRGCIRMSPHDVEDVYDILSVGSKVTVRH